MSGSIPGTFSPLRWRDERWRVMESGCAMTDWQQSTLLDQDPGKRRKLFCNAFARTEEIEKKS